MFVIEVTYKVSLEEIDLHLMEHRAFLDRYYAAGKLIASGPKVPRDGGIILAQADSPEEVERIIKDDIFHQLDLANYRIKEFKATKRSANIQELVASDGGEIK